MCFFNSLYIIIYLSFICFCMSELSPSSYSIWLVLQSAVHSRPDLKHLLFPEQLSFLQPHFASSWQQAATVCKDVQCGCRLWSSSFRPHCFGLGSACSRIRVWPHTWPAWYTALFVCSISADSLGGIVSYDFCLYANKSNLASLTFLLHRIDHIKWQQIAQEFVYHHPIYFW